MNQFQTLQTALTIVLCVTVAFLAGRGNFESNTTATQPQTVYANGNTNMPIEKFQEIERRLTRLEMTNDNEEQDWQATLSSVQGLRNSLDKLRSDFDALPEPDASDEEAIAEIRKTLAEFESSRDAINTRIEDLAKNLPKNAPGADSPERKHQDDLELKADRHFARVEPKFHQHMALKKYDDARWVMRFPKTLRPTRSGRKADELLKQIDTQMSVDYENLEKEARRYSDKGRVIDAIDLLRGVVNKFPNRADLHEKAQTAIDKLQEERTRIAEDPKVHTGSSNDEINEWIQLMGSEDPSIAIEAKRKLREVRTRALGPLLKAIDDKNSRIRWGAVTLLSMLETEKAEEALISCLRDVDTQVRFSALEGLVKLKSYKSIEEVIKLASDKDFTIAKKAVRTFEKITGHKVVFENIPITEKNIDSVAEMMSIYWEKNKEGLDKP